ncbi:MAG TPA: response regulator [Catenuloplanes sp.]|jgi:CheY-like chemotaxis protein
MTRRRILVVDDDDSIREIATVTLDVIGGWEVSTASSGGEALSRAAIDQPEAVLMDVMMPGLDGPGTVERLQADQATRHIPVIMLTAKVQPTERERFAGLPGVFGVIAKPFDPMSLADQISDLLGWSG